MAVSNTGNTVVGTVPGLKKELAGHSVGANIVVPERITYVTENPDGIVTCVTGSDIAFDVINNAFYIGDIANGAGGSAWSLLSTD